jgi:hypothetical protein
MIISRVREVDVAIEGDLMSQTRWRKAGILASSAMVIVDPTVIN